MNMILKSAVLTLLLLGLGSVESHAGKCEVWQKRVDRAAARIDASIKVLKRRAETTNDVVIRRDLRAEILNLEHQKTQIYQNDPRPNGCRD